MVRDFQLGGQEHQLEQLLEQEQKVESVVLEASDVTLAIEGEVYDEVEGIKRFYKEAGKTFTEMQNVHDQSIQEFIRSLPQNISYNTVFENSNGNLDETLKDDDAEVNEKTKKKPKQNLTTCKICQKTLGKGSLNNHMKILHSGVKLNCDQCNMDFNNKKDLWTHKQKIHQVMKKSKSAKTKLDNSSLEINPEESSLLENALNVSLGNLDEHC